HYPGRIGFTDANSSPEPNDYNQHGGIYLHLDRHGQSFINFGNGFEFAIIDEPPVPDQRVPPNTATEPWERGSVTTVTSSFPHSTPISPMPLSRKPPRGLTALIVSNRCSRATS